MQAGMFRTSWIIIKSCYFTLIPSVSTLFYSLFGKINRTWVDKISRRWAHRLLNAVQAKVEIYNPHNVSPDDQTSYIMMCNHSSLYDIPLSLLALPGSIRMLAKKELSRIPIVGIAMKKAEFPFVDRHNRRQAIKDLAAVKNLLASGIIMWIAPEGTRSLNGELGKFKKGGFITAIETKAKIIPIGIKGADKILPSHSLRPNLNQVTEIHIGQPVDASCYTLEQKGELIREIESQIHSLISE